jgi:hypothetical protein
MLWENYGLEKLNTIAIRRSKYDAAAITSHTEFAHCLVHRDILAFRDLHTCFPTALLKAIIIGLREKPAFGHSHLLVCLKM